MEDVEIKDKWYYLIVRDPGSCHEQFVGLSKEGTDEKFLPAFKTKEDAKACFTLMPKDIFNGEYEVQAVIEDDILNTSKENGYQVFILDHQGKILKQLG